MAVIAPGAAKAYCLRMKALTANANALIMGMLAMLFCLATPVVAAPVPHFDDLMATSEAAPDMPCCPEKGTTNKACNQMCPAVAAVTISFAFVPGFRTLSFQTSRQVRSGLTYDPVAPPPR